MKAEIDWAKPIVGDCGNGGTVPARFLCRGLRGDKPIVVAVDHAALGAKGEGLVAADESGKADCYTFRNTPPAPVPFEFTKYIKVFRDPYNGKLRTGGAVWDELPTQGPGDNPFVACPVTIRGEWREDGDGR